MPRDRYFLCGTCLSVCFLVLHGNGIICASRNESPEKIHIVIYDDKGIEQSVSFGPYNEGSDVSLVCEARGGRPRPGVFWFIGTNSTLIDDSYQYRSNDLVVNYLILPNIGRQHLHERLICQAANNNTVPPETKAVFLDINLKPQTVSILTKEKYVSAGKRYEVECRTSGSRPNAIITWWKGTPAKRLLKNFTELNNQSLSVLNFVPVIDDDGKYLICRAENPSIPDSALEDKWRLNVHYVPVVTLKMGSSLNPEDIKEGDDVYFECNIRANPKAYNLSWFHDDMEIYQNVTGSVILSNQSLVLQNIVRSTAGNYSCAATNSEGKGSSYQVKLVVKSNPEKIHIVIYDDQGIDQSVLLGPYNEGSDVSLICEARGGRPRPSVIWFLGSNSTIIDDSYQYRSNDLVVNHVILPNIGRQHLHERLICQAANNNTVLPETKTVFLDINLKPQTVSILTNEKYVSAGKRYEVECRTSGSRPNAIITWWKGSSPAKRLLKTFTELNNQSLSILNFVPVIDDDGKYLICRAENPSIPESALEDKWRLNVHYVPVVTLKMGSALNPEDIKEGDDVYFECSIMANPNAYKLSWFHNNMEIYQNITGGVILSNQTLVLQNIVRSTAGNYTCIATNVEGKGSSYQVKLVVKYLLRLQDRDQRITITSESTPNRLNPDPLESVFANKREENTHVEGSPIMLRAN